MSEGKVTYTTMDPGQYELRAHGKVPLGSVVQTQVEVTVGEGDEAKTRKQTQFVFSPLKEFKDVGDVSSRTMRDLKADVEKAFGKKLPDVPEPEPIPAEEDEAEVDQEPDLGEVGDDEADLDLD